MLLLCALPQEYMSLHTKKEYALMDHAAKV
jgi:hypothetical protein